MSLVWIAIAVVLTGWLLLLLTSASAELHTRSALRTIVMAVWLLIVTTGWGVFAYLAYGGAPGGLDGVWQWILDQTLVSRIAMWVALLPYMLGVWIWTFAWAVWQKTAAIIALAAATFVLSLKRR